jgi:branched-chain amino acid transport system substrate-binding protein
MLARSRALTACAVAMLATAAGGCATTTTTASVSSGTLSVYVSVPAGRQSPETQDVLAAERLAFQQAGAQVAKFKIKLVPFSGHKLSDNARQAIGDGGTIAYIGEIPPGGSEDTIGITNAEDILQVSPTDTAVEQTQRTPAVPNSPDRYYESLSSNHRTYARVVPTDALEAKALVGEMQARGVTRLYVVSDGSAYGNALAYAVKTDAAPGITVASSAQSAGAAFYAGSSAAGATALFNQLSQASPTVKLFAPSALYDDAFVSSLSAAAQRSLYVSSPGFTSSDLPALGKQFVSAFRATFRRAPAPQAIFGYEAMAAVMAVLHREGAAAGNRATIVQAFFAIRNRVSALGTYSINQNGDTSIAPFIFSRARAGSLVPYKAVQEQG